MLNKYVVKLELRYSDAPNDIGSTYRTNIITLGVFDDVQQAYTCGNESLAELEKHYPLNKNWNRKERFSANGGCFGSAKHLISDSGYLTTPFSFFLSIETLKHTLMMEAVQAAHDATIRYKTHRENERA
jgi:hypothetical protein